MHGRPTSFSRILYFMGAFILCGVTSGFLARWLFAPPSLAPGQSASEFQSGPQVGDKMPGPFHPLNINGKAAGDEDCLFCRYGNAPVVMVFAAKSTPGVTTLARQLEKAAAGAIHHPEGNKEDEVGACLIVTENNDDVKGALTRLADAEKLKQVVLGMIESRYLKKYQLHSEAEVTVLMYSNQVVRVNRAYKAGELTEKAATEVGTEAATFLKQK